MNTKHPYSVIPLDHIPTVTLTAEELQRPASIKIKPEIIKIEGEDERCPVIGQEKKKLEIVNGD